MRLFSILLAVFVASSLASTAHAQAPLDNGFTYQGVLSDNGSPLNGNIDILYILTDSLGASAGPNIVIPNQTITNGLINHTLDFGSGAFNGDARKLRIDIASPAGSGVFNNIGLVDLHATPYAHWSKSTGASLQNVFDNSNTLNASASPLHFTAGSNIQVNSGALNFIGANAVFNIGDSSADTTNFLGSVNFLNNAPAVFEDTATFNNTAYMNKAILEPSGVYVQNAADTAARIRLYTYSVSDAGVGQFNGPNSTNIVLSSLAGIPDHGYLSVADGNGTFQAGMYVDAGGLGVIFADIKNFAMDHPLDDSKEIVYTSLEGPEAGAYARGTATLNNGTATIAFEQHFTLVANPDSLTIQLTPRSADSMGLAVVEQTATGFTVRELARGTGTYDFHWHATAVRAGYEDQPVVRDRVHH